MDQKRTQPRPRNPRCSSTQDEKEDENQGEERVLGTDLFFVQLIVYEHTVAHPFPHKKWLPQLIPTISGETTAWVLEEKLQPQSQVGRQQQNCLWPSPALSSYLLLSLCCFHIWIQAQVPYKHLHWSTFS